MGKRNKKKQNESKSTPLSKGKQQMSRKERRKEERKLKKMRKNAFFQKKELPTLESLSKEKEDKEKAVENKLKVERNKRKKKAQKQRDKRKQEEKKQEQRQAVVDGLKQDEAEIKKYEKLLHLNKRKTKTISQGFKNDGLDYLLEAVDSEVLQTLMSRGENDITTADDALGALDDLDENESSEGSMDGDEDMPMDDDESGDNEAASEQDGDSMSDNFIDDSYEEDTPKTADMNDSDNESSGDEHNGSKDDDDEEPFSSASDEEDYSGYYWPSDEENASEGEVEIEMEDPKTTELLSESTTQKKGILKKTEKEREKKSKKETADSQKNGISVKFDLEDNQQQSSQEHKKAKKKISNAIIMEEEAKEKEGELPKKKRKILQNETEAGKNSEKKRKLNIGLESDEDFESEDSFEDEEDFMDSDGEESKPELKEDIYGRLRDESGNVVTSQLGAYVPPGKRLAMASGDDEKRRIQLDRLKRQVKGQFNRLSENNMQSIANHIEDLFRQHSRGDLTDTLTSVVLDSCASEFPVPERLVMEHCMLVAVLNSNVGGEIGASLMQSLAVKFKDLVNKGASYGSGKEMDNLVVVLANLYNFRVLHCLLIFDIMRQFADNFTEKDIDLLLIMLRNVGFSLRKDDPLALKEFIVSVQNQASKCDTKDERVSVRMKFMLEVIMHIKNNNMRKIPNYDPENLDRLKKLLRNFTGANTSVEGPLRISLEDLLSAKVKGKWWLVGSAWSGRGKPGEAGTEPDAKLKSSAPNVSDKLLELARKQRMNTDVRRTIFCALMTSEDYADAFEKMLQLGLKNQQEREIIHVIADVCLQEKRFNPFYVYLAQKLSQYNRRFQRMLQFALWDKFKVMETLEEMQISHLARFCCLLVNQRTMHLSLFKVIEFAELDKARVNFMKKVLTSLLTESNAETVTELFQTVAGIPALQQYRDGIKLFLKHFLLKSKAKTQNNVELLRERTDLVEKALDSKGGRVQM